MSDLVKVENLAVSFRIDTGTVPAVEKVSFRVRPGSTVALVGESGSGKSTVAQAIMGLLPANGTLEQGRVLFDDPEWERPASMNGSGRVDLAALAPNGPEMRSIRGGRISMIFQDPMTSLSPLHTVGDQVGEALRLHRNVNRDEARTILVEMFTMVGFPRPERTLNLYPFELSGGMRQRAMIAMALVSRPSLLIADEPTTALDVTVQAQILKLLKDLRADLHMAILIITHDLGVVANMADEVVVMRHGRVMESGTVDDIYRRPGHPYLKALFKAVPRVDALPGEMLQPIHPVKGAGAHLISHREPWPEDADPDEPLLSVRNVSKTFTVKKGGLFAGRRARVKAVRNVSLEIRRGESLGLVGESGCGKTTLSKLIMRAFDPDQGDVIFNDRGRRVDLLALNRGDMVPYRQRIQYVFQDPASSLDPRMTVFGLISEPLLIHGIGDHAHRSQMVQELLRVVGLDPRSLNRYPHSFSGGQKQRIGIARSLALKPEMLLCDEPVSALDVSVQAQVLNLFKDLQKDMGLTYLFVSHNLAVVRYLCDSIVVMCAGRVVEQAPADSLFGDSRHPYTRALLSAVPEADPDKELDLSALMEGRASDPTQWPEPFTVTDDMPGRMTEVAEGHSVLLSGDGP